MNPQDTSTRISIVSDEVAPSFGEAIALAVPLGITRYELRKLNGLRVPNWPDAMTNELLELINKHGLQITSISPGFFRQRWNDPLTADELREGLPRCFRLMEKLNVRRLSVFSFLREAAQAPIPPQAVEQLLLAKQICHNEGIELIIENSDQGWADTGVHLTEVAELCDLNVVWDPANAAAAGDRDLNEACRRLSGRISTVHVKNWAPHSGWTYVNNGIVHWGEQIRLLQASDYAGSYCIENHLPADSQATAINYRQLCAWLQQQP
jgi:sugar phosphate isomerase/epimerase